ncbi:MAG: hypothetical protein ACT4PM_12190 [Gemmatimonadales bacterium]
MIIKRFDAVSVGKVMGVCYLLIGLLAGLLIAAMGSMVGGATGLPFAGTGIAAIIIVPIVYGIIGFIGGIIGAFIYNLVAGWVGGVVMDTE